MANLTEIANRYGTDKGSFINGYTVVYQMLFAAMTDRPLNILEIGLATGGPELGGSSDREVIDAPSIRMWHEYFPDARVYGLDISDFSRFENEWFKFFRVDCGMEEDFAKVRCDDGLFDIILDDGSHASYHQQLTMIKLFPLLKSGGYYIIEDLNWQPDVYERTLPRVPKTGELLDGFLRRGEFAGDLGAFSARVWDEVARGIGGMMLFDEDFLMRQRQIYNRRHGITPAQPHYVELQGLARLTRSSYLRRLGEAACNAARAVAGRTARSPRRIKVAAMQKL